MEKKRKHILIYWIEMVVLFVVVLLSQQIVASIMQGSLSTSKYGAEATFEILWAGLVLIVVLLFKNKYIFTQKREGFFHSVKYALPELLLSSFFVLISVLGIIFNHNSFDIYSVFNLALYCLFIGIVEEFLCRGWLLNEFLERYSRSRKEIMLSILFSSLIFGVVHFLNIGETQGFFETLVQVMNAAAGGVFLALVYYKTKNIWVVVATHAIWDFSLFLGNVNSLGECLTSAPTTMTVVLNVVRGILLIVAYGIFCYWLYRQTDLYTKDSRNTKDYLIGIGIALYVVCLLFIHEYGKTELCPDYKRKTIEDSYRVSFYKYDKFALDSGLVLESDSKTGQLFIKDSDTNAFVYLTENKKYYHYLLVENDYDFTIMIQTSSNVILYGKFSKADFMDQKDDYLKTMPDKFNKIVVPDIADLGTMEIEGDPYLYPIVRSSIGELLYFDRSNQLYINK